MSRNKGFLVCFLGIDGSGKTTLAKCLSRRMESEGIRTKYMWWLDNEESLLRRLLRSLGKLHPGLLNDKGTATESNTSLLISAYNYMVLLDYVRHAFFGVWLPIVFGKAVVCDRYIYDTVIALSIEFRYSKQKLNRLLRLFSSMSPRPNILFLVDVPEEVSVQRKNDISSEDQLSLPRRLYLELGSQMSARFLDGTRSIEELTSLIWKETTDLRKDYYE